VEEHDGRLFLTMELVDGRPLSEGIPRGGLPLDRLLRIGIEVADALAAAQQRGITHRDVKPANIVLTPAGRAKVLDFGLAKVHEAEAAGAGDDVTRMSSRQNLTGEGRIIGTVAYMSPEQAEGKPVDPRSDIFSLGVVLYEMATGERPFRGDTNVSIISSIIKDTPAPVTDSNPNLPADLARIIRRCLAKDPERRYQTAADLRNELEELKQDSASGAIAIVRPVPGRRRRLTLVATSVVAVVAIVGAALLVFNRRQAPASSREASFTIDKFARLTSTGTALMAAISPDGKYVVHVKGEPGGFGLWMRQTATTSDVRIVPPADVRFDGLAFAPDANYVYYSAYAGTAGIASLYRVPVLGGAPVRLLDDIDSQVTFSPDQKRIAFLRGLVTQGTTALMVADADGGNAKTLASATAPDKFQSDGVSWSPDGRTILTTAGSTRPGVPTIIYAIDAQSGAAHPLGKAWGFLRDVQWMPDGRSFLVTGIDLSGVATPQIWQVEFPSGERARVTNDLNSYIGLSLSSDGRTMATVQTETTGNVYIADGPGKEPRRVTSGAGRADGAPGIAWLPDGRLVYSSTASGMPQLWICDADGGNAHQLTSMVSPATNPQSSPDGRWIYFSGFAKGPEIFRIAPDGSDIRQLTTDGDARNPVVSTDGKTIYLTALRSGAPRLMAIPAEGGTPRQVSDQYFRALGVSFDGSRLVGVSWSDELRRSVMATLSVADTSLHLMPDLPFPALFMPDGGFVALHRGQGKSNLLVQPPGPGPSRALTAPDEQSIFSAAVSRDGRVAYSRGMSLSDVVLVRAK
jgi:Tol biopolymer transport system component